MKNQIPKDFVNYDIYFNLIDNQDSNYPYYDILPRPWAFELSCNGEVVFSKLEFKQWPNYNAVADKCLKLPGLSDKIVTAKKLKKEAPKAAAKEVDMASGDMKLKEEADKSADD